MDKSTEGGTAVKNESDETRDKRNEKISNEDPS